MNTRSSSISVWIIFLIFVAIAFAIVFPKYGLVARRVDYDLATTVAARLTNLSNANYTLRKSNQALGISVTNCTEVPAIVGSDPLPRGFRVGNKRLNTDQLNTCLLLRPIGKPIEFIAIGIT